MKLNYGISMSNCFTKAGEYINEKSLKKAYLNFLDYFTNFALENNLKMIEIVSFPPFDANVLSQIKEDIRKRISKFETIYHLPSWEINICAINPYVRKASIDETKSLIGLAKELGIKKVSMHPGCYTSMSDIYVLLSREVKHIAQKSIFDIFEHCKSKNIELCIENLPFGEPFFQKPEEFELFVKKGISIVVDTAHAITSGINPVDFVRKFGNKISDVHLVDGFKGKPDVHYALGAGEVNYSNFLDSLIKIKYTEPVILELKSEKDFLESLNVLKRDEYL